MTAKSRQFTKNWRFVAMGVFFVASLSGCEALIGLLGLPITTVRLVNDSDFAIRVTVVYADDQNLPREILEEVGTHLEYDLAAGQVASFARDCDALQIVAIERAELMVIGGSGPSAESETLRDGADFGCRDIITFTFDHSDAVTDFDVTASVEDR
jgi:hypothetical protein